MSKRRLTIENRLLIEQLLKLNYKLKDIAEVIGNDCSSISREIKKRRISGKNDLPECDKLKRFPFVCYNCNLKTSCKYKKYYYIHKKAQSHYDYLFIHSRKGIDMTIDEIDYWNDYFEDKLKKKSTYYSHI